MKRSFPFALGVAFSKSALEPGYLKSMGTGVVMLSDIFLEPNDGLIRMQVEVSSEAPLSCMFQKESIFGEIRGAPPVVAHFGLPPDTAEDEVTGSQPSIESVSVA